MGTRTQLRSAPPIIGVDGSPDLCGFPELLSSGIDAGGHALCTLPDTLNSDINIRSLNLIESGLTESTHVSLPRSDSSPERNSNSAVIRLSQPRASKSSSSSLRASSSSLSLGSTSGKNRMSRASTSLLATLNKPDDESCIMLSRLENLGVNDGRIRAAKILYHSSVQTFIGGITVFNFYLVCWDADIEARGDESPFGIKLINWLCLAAFTLELLLRLYVERQYTFQNLWNIFDIIIVCLGIIGEVLLASSSFGVIRIFRCFRLARILKAVTLVSGLRELRSLIRGLVSCIRTLFWSIMLLFVVITIWATIAVIMLHPLMDPIAATGVWDDCERCPRAFLSVMSENLTFFQTIVAGDSWGLIAIPVMEHHAWASIIFLGAFFTIVFGVLNLIIAVLVDTAADARADDSISQSKDRDRMERKERRELGQIFTEIDADGSGALTYEELAEGAKSVPQFGTRLRAMDINQTELQELFRMLDEDGSGEIDAEEFIDSLYRMKCGDEKTATSFVRHYVSRLWKDQAQLAIILENMRTAISLISGKFEGSATAVLTQISELEDIIGRQISLDRSPDVRSANETRNFANAGSVSHAGSSGEDSSKDVIKANHESQNVRSRHVNTAEDRLSLSKKALETLMQIRQHFVLQSKEVPLRNESGCPS